MPTVADASLNPRLFRRLDEARKRPIVWLHGAPGAGKTTLVANYLAVKGLQPIWYRLDEDDADPATLFFYLGMADAHASGTGGAPRLPALTPEYLNGLGAFSRRFFQKLMSGRTRPIVVLDDYHELPADSPVHACIAAGLKEVPTEAHVLVVSRAPPPKEFARLRVNGMIDVIAPETLRLGVDEAQAVAAARGIHLGAAVLDEVVERTQGWTAGLVLMMEAAERGTQLAGGGAVPELLFDYFAGEIFQRMERREQRVLMELAVMPSMTVAAAETLTGGSDVGRLLEQLSRRSYFTVRDAQAEPNYRFHPLFRDFLLASAKDTLEDVERARIRLRAAHALEAAGQPDAAVPLLEEAAAWPDLARLIRSWAVPLTEQGRHGTLSSWLDRLPADTVAGDGWLSFWAAVARSPFEPAAARRSFHHALTQFERSEDVAGIFLAWAGLADSIGQDAFANQAELDTQIERLRDLVRRYSTFPSAEVEFRVAAVMFTALSRRSGNRAELSDWRERAFAAAKAVGKPGLVETIRVLSIMSFLMDGDFVAALDQLEALPPPEALDRAPLLQTYAYLATGFAQHYQQIPGSCETTATIALARSKETGIYIWTHLQALFAATELCWFGEIEKSRGWLRKAAELAEPGNLFKGAGYHLASCYVALVAKDNATALRSGRQAVEFSVASGWLWNEALGHLALAEALTESGDDDAASVELAASESVANKSVKAAILFSAELLRADLLLKRADPEAGLVLRKAMTLGARTGARRALLTPVRMSRLCAASLAGDIEPDYARLLIRLGRLPPPEARIAEWPWPVKILTFGGFQIFKDGEPLVLSRKTPRRLFTMLKAIIAFGATNVPEARIVDAVWADEDGDAGHRAFDVAVHRLRKLIGDNRFIVVKDSRVSLDPGRCWLDLWAFEAGLSVDGACAGKARAIALYKGAFLADDDDMPWIEPRRRQLAARFARATATSLAAP